MSLLRTVVLSTAALSAVTGGVLFGFSSFVLPGLRRLPIPVAVQAMQAINIAAPRSLLMLPLFGGAIGGIVVVVMVIAGAPTHRAPLLVGGLLSVATVVITMAYHVPRNDALGRLDPSSAAAAAAWPVYAAGWGALNHVRSATALLGAGILVLASRALP